MACCNCGCGCNGGNSCGCNCGQRKGCKCLANDVYNLIQEIQDLAEDLQDAWDA